jgi:transcription antitermination factor NusG
MKTHDMEGFKERFLELVQEIDTIELLQWSHDELESQVSRLNNEAAHNINEGDAVEVTRGPAAGMQGTVIGRAEQEEGVLLVDLEGVNLGMPVPIPALALNVVAP